ncbi:MAG TPA: type II secretion system protein [Thermoanaerobaculia bacterium]|nr:type II secretion system protein [Thermoanaerobaculia bacterium]
MKSSRGFTLVETLVGLLILTLVVTTSLAVFVERQRRLKEADDTIVAYQALANEAEVQRQVPYASLSTTSTQSFATDTMILVSLKKPATSVAVKQPGPNRKIVTMTVSWNDGLRHADLSIARVSIPRGYFW